MFFGLIVTLLTLAAGAFCPYPQNFSRDESLIINNITGFFNKKVSTIKIGGYFGIVTSLIAYYNGFAAMLTPSDIFTLPTGKYSTP